METTNLVSHSSSIFLVVYINIRLSQHEKHIIICHLKADNILRFSPIHSKTFLLHFTDFHLHLPAFPNPSTHRKSKSLKAISSPFSLRNFQRPQSKPSQKPKYPSFKKQTCFFHTSIFPLYAPQIPFSRLYALERRVQKLQ